MLSPLPPTPLPAVSVNKESAAGSRYANEHKQSYTHLKGHQELRKVDPDGRKRKQKMKVKKKILVKLYVTENVKNYIHV